MLPLMPHPLMKNRVIAVELNHDALKLISYSAEQIADNIFTKLSLLPEGETRIGIKEIQHNHCPIIVPLQAVSAEELGRWSIDANRLQINPVQAESVRAELLAHSVIIIDKLAKVFGKERRFEPSDPDAALYDGFIDKSDKLKFSKARSSQGKAELVFNDARLAELYFRYKARNWPESMDPGQRLSWQWHKRQKLDDVSLQSYMAHIDVLIAENPGHAKVLDSLKDWAVQISSELANR